MQGNGEVSGTANEQSLAGTFRFVVHKRRSDGPFAEDAKNLMFIGIDHDLDRAMKFSTRKMIDWLVKNKGRLDGVDGGGVDAAPDTVGVTRSACVIHADVPGHVPPSTDDTHATMDLRISPARPADVDACAGLMAAAFLDDDVLRLFVRGDDRREERLRAFFAAELSTVAIPAGTLDVARRTTDGAVVGVGEWHPPQAPPGTRIRGLRAAPRLLAAIGARHLLSVARTQRAFQRVTPRFPHWYLAHLAVGPDARGLGLGTRLLEHRLALIDGSGLPTYLESTSTANRRLYERHGFAPVGTIDLTPQLHATAMLRPVRGHDDGAAAPGRRPSR